MTESDNRIPKRVWFLVIASIAVLIAAFYVSSQHSEEAEIETITRDGVVTQIQRLNRLQTVAFSVDTVVTSQRQGSWMRLWQDEQKALFIAHGRVQAGIDLSALTPEMVQVTPPVALDDNALSTGAEGNAAANLPQIHITLPPSEIFAVYLDNMEVYDWQTGIFGMTQVDPKILDQAQQMAKKEVLERACRGEVMTMAIQNAQAQVQQLFALTGAVVTVSTQGAGACQMPVTG